MKAILIGILALLFVTVMVMRAGRDPLDICVDLDTQRDRVLCHQAVRDSGTLSLVASLLASTLAVAVVVGISIYRSESAIEQMKQTLEFERAQLRVQTLAYAERVRQHYGRELQQSTRLFVGRGVATKSTQ